MKYFGILALALAACVVITNAQSHNSLWGSIGPGDNLLDRQIIKKSYKFLRIVTQDYTFPPPGAVLGRMITGIRVTDQYTNGKGGYASLYAGGPGNPSVTIHFKSQRNHGFNFIVEIFGR
uniref:Venom polypeptide n=1 Tax=Dolopus genitalis TaxID=2488630 RepID=A0A3G5BIB8_DOLGE|nr:venom polypeptide [Dolopus genitalis]